MIQSLRMHIQTSLDLIIFDLTIILDLTMFLCCMTTCIWTQINDILDLMIVFLLTKNIVKSRLDCTAALSGFACGILAWINKHVCLLDSE